MDDCLRCGESLSSSCKYGICGSCRGNTLEAYDGYKDAAGRAELELFAEEFLACWHCGWPTDHMSTELGTKWKLHIHHIFGGPNRKHIRANLSRLCNHCHDMAHRNRLKKEHVLWLKKQHDPGGYNRKDLKKLLKRPVPHARKPQ